ncbi:hypothetical protein CAPTEDRAFT_98019 [Capitella teleta]|uniref:Globin domain-containing protein n=1 Tax=Capitella teleta TaxID=283909 RepID=R7TFF7_CAPTE|nr:hypothetical protein CAPTEDRAFT_98019 [Capitella teleta]|eukprot:ELT89756.1 hypothetical protein CAPTEDRAFT_98019 [Capitella teleta]
MGICSTHLRPVVVPESNELFTDRQKAIITKTWRHMGNDLTGRGSKVFLKIFNLHPEVKQLFPSLKNDNEDQLLKNPCFRGHASRFMQSVGAVVENLDTPGDLSPLLIDLGRKHVLFGGFTPEYFAAFTEGMMCIWSEELGKGFTDEVSVAWKTVFDFIMSQLQDGYAKASADSTVSSNRE